MCSIRERAVKKLLIHVAKLKTPAAHDDGFLSSTPSVGETQQIVCRLVNTATQPRDFVLADKTVTRSEWQILFPLDAPVDANDAVEIGEQTFIILGTDRGAAGRSLLTAFCTKQS